MNKKLTGIFINGGLAWGIPFALFISVLRWIEYKPVAFGSFGVLLAVSIVAGMLWGLTMYKPAQQNPNGELIIVKFLQLMADFAVILGVYGVVFRYVLIPHDLAEGLWKTVIFLLIVFICIGVRKRLILKQP